MVSRELGPDGLIGLDFGHYRIVEKIGAGGMGEVYRAYDGHLDREVAIKVLPLGALTDESSRKRFRKEALALSKLNHPNIATIHDFDTQQVVDFLVMEYVPGSTLANKLVAGGLSEKEIARLGLQLAEGLEAAHEHGVIHRDLKPQNLRLTEEGRLKILDFGLARLLAPAASEAETESMTRAVVGTLPYMSPEQLRGEAVDARSDIWSAGIVLYEMATGELPFHEKASTATADAILHAVPLAPRTKRNALSVRLDEIVLKCLEKEPENRYQSAKELAVDLRRLGLASDPMQQLRVSDPKGLKGGTDSNKFAMLQRLRRPIIAIPFLLVFVLLAYLAASAIYQNRKAAWAREIALPKAQQLIAKDNWASAYALAVEAEKYIPNDPQLKEVFSGAAILLSVQTSPAGADVFFKPYAGASDNWELIGRTPIAARRIARGFKEYKITKDGWDAVTGFTGSDQKLPPEKGVQIHLERTLAQRGTTPPDMVFVDGGKYAPTIIYFRSLPEVDLEAFLIDRFETTNSQYQAFVDAGGYREQKYWKNEFYKNGRKLSWDEATTGFTDKTGRSGPATWELGHFPEGQADYPVSGISWYEAAAYAEFAGKILPTLYHWNKAAGVYDLADTSTANTSMIEPVIMNSNFGGSGPAPVGKFRGISPYGAFDMAGNVREWIWNGAPGGRYLLGGSWGTPEYLFYESDELLSPFDRSLNNGFRCVKLLGNRTLPGATTAEVPAPRPESDFVFPKPVSDDVFKIYRSYYSYDKSPLNVVVEAPDDSSPHNIRQRVTFNAAYGGERVVAYLFFPKNAMPPYQTVLIFPGAGAVDLKSVDAYASIDIAMFTRAGRAVVFPVYKGTFERTRVDTSTPTLERDYTIMLYKDLARTLDYIETRPEFDSGRVAYFGLSWGAAEAPIFGALEKRIKLFVLEGGGLVQGSLPEIAPVNFAPRDKAPTVIFNGRYDIAFPAETSAKPLLRLLGTAKQDKALILFDGGHVPPLDSKLKKEMLDWLDRYFGRVR